VASPPVVVQGPSPGSRPTAPAPQVESFDEETYRCKPGDTFESICEAKYLSPKFAQALLLFNRNHPLAAPGVLQNPPVLQVGQAIYIPPAGILQRRYPTAVRDLSPLPAAGTPAPAPAADPGAAAAASSGTRGYRVRGDKEWLRDIARRTLGDSERWLDLYRLNPFVKPEYPVPPNTVLRLPAEARVAPENMP
jgi:nucleoid-associated protein YgaU